MEPLVGQSEAKKGKVYEGHSSADCFISLRSDSETEVKMRSLVQYIVLLRRTVELRMDERVYVTFLVSNSSVETIPDFAAFFGC